jgi:hypothetical protein
MWDIEWKLSCPPVQLICVRVSDAVVSREHDFLYFCRPTVTLFHFEFITYFYGAHWFNLKFKISTKQPLEMSHPVSLRYILISSHLHSGLHNPLILSFSVLSDFLFCYIPVLPISLDLIALVMFCEEYTFWICALIPSILLLSLLP